MVFLVFVLFYHLYRVLHIIKRDIRHNAVAQVEDEAVLAFHTVEQAVDAFFNYFFIGIKNMRIKVALYGYACGKRFLISSRSTFQSIDITSGLASAIQRRKNRAAFTERYHRDIFTVQFADDLCNITVLNSL
jgi:hypothetical protein